MAERTVLVVDDDPAVCEVAARVLRRAGYSVVTASDGQRALEILKQRPVQLVISDQQMPGMSGIELLRVIRVRHPKVVRVMLTGDSDPETAVRSINEGEVYRFLRKPWTNSDLKAVADFGFKAFAEGEERHKLAAEGLRQQQARGEGPPDPADKDAEVQLLAEGETPEK